MERFRVGIDVSARSLSVAVRDVRGGVVEGTFDNDANGHTTLIRFLKKRASKRIVRVALESTGIYGVDLAMALHRARFEVMVVNPRASANFAKASMQRSKTDRVDAKMLVEFCEQKPFTGWQPPSEKALEIRTISRRVHALMTTIRDEKNRMHAATHMDAGAVVRKSITATVKALQKQVDVLREEALKRIHDDAVLTRRYELLLTVKGIAKISAIAILAELAMLPADMTDRQWVAHAGLDPREVQSGTSLRLPPRISKQGNKYLRAALYLPARVACRFDPGVKSFATRLRDRGKKPLQIHVAVMRKFLHSIHAMFASGQPFDTRRYDSAAGAVGTSGIAPSAISEVSTTRNC